MSDSAHNARSFTLALWQRLRALSLRARLTGLAMLLLIATLFEPHWTITRNAVDFVVTLDITQSMSVLDYELDGKPVSRLVHAKHLLREALGELPCGSRIGWAIFTEYRVLMLVSPVEVCANYQELTGTLDRIDGRMAWSNASEVAKGVIWGLRTVRDLGSGHGLMFITDGQESPPINPRQRPTLEGKQGASGKPYTVLDQNTWQYVPVYEGKPGEVRGLIVGVGGDELKPIPKFDPDGHQIGFWQADEVMQTDVMSAGRTGSEAGEKMVDENGKEVDSMKPTMTEHLSSLRNGYLLDLARDSDLGYHRMSDTAALLRAMTAPEFAHPVPYRADLRLPLAIVALVLLLAAHLPALHGLAARVPLRNAASRAQ